MRIETISKAAAILVAGHAPVMGHHSVAVNYLPYDEGSVELMATISEVDIRTPNTSSSTTR